MARIKPSRIALLYLTPLHLALAGVCEGAETVQSVSVAVSSADNHNERFRPERLRRDVELAAISREGLQQMKRAKGWSDSSPEPRDPLSVRLTPDGNFRIPEGPISTEAASLVQVSNHAGSIVTGSESRPAPKPDDGDHGEDDTGSGSDDTKETDSSDSDSPSKDSDSKDSEPTSCFGQFLDFIKWLFRCLLSPFKWVYEKLCYCFGGGSGDSEKKHPEKKNQDPASKKGDDEQGSDNQGDDNQGNGNDRSQDGGNRNANRSESESQRQTDHPTRTDAEHDGSDADSNGEFHGDYRTYPAPTQFLHSTDLNRHTLGLDGDLGQRSSLELPDLSLDFEADIVDGVSLYDRCTRDGQSASYNNLTNASSALLSKPGSNHNSSVFLGSPTPLKALQPLPFEEVGLPSPLTTASHIDSLTPYPSMSLTGPGSSLASASEISTSSSDRLSVPRTVSPEVEPTSKSVKSSLSSREPSIHKKSRNCKERLSTIADTPGPDELNGTELPVGVESTTITIPAVDIPAITIPSITMPATSSRDAYTIPEYTVPAQYIPEEVIEVSADALISELEPEERIKVLRAKAESLPPHLRDWYRKMDERMIASRPSYEPFKCSPRNRTHDIRSSLGVDLDPNPTIKMPTFPTPTVTAASSSTPATDTSLGGFNAAPDPDVSLLKPETAETLREFDRRIAELSDKAESLPPHLHKWYRETEEKLKMTPAAYEPFQPYPRNSTNALPGNPIGKWCRETEHSLTPDFQPYSSNSSSLSPFKPSPLPYTYCKDHPYALASSSHNAYPSATPASNLSVCDTEYPLGRPTPLQSNPSASQGPTSSNPAGMSTSRSHEMTFGPGNMVGGSTFTPTTINDFSNLRSHEMTFGPGNMLGGSTAVPSTITGMTGLASHGSVQSNGEVMTGSTFVPSTITGMSDLTSHKMTYGSTFVPSKTTTADFSKLASRKMTDASTARIMAKGVYR